MMTAMKINDSETGPATRPTAMLRDPVRPGLRWQSAAATPLFAHAGCIPKRPGASLPAAVQKLAPLLLCVLAIMPLDMSAATNDLSGALQRGLFEEEANRNLDAAAQAYQTVSAQFDKDRKLAATAIFRLGEVYRKQGKTNEAVAQYERIVRDFSDQETLVMLSRQNLTGLGVGGFGKASAPGTAAVALGNADYQQDAVLLTKLMELSLEDLRRVLPTLVPDPLLTQLLSQYHEAEVKYEEVKNDYAPDHPTSVQARAVLKKLDEQIEARISGIFKALEMRVAVGQAASQAESSANAAGMSHYVIQAGDTLSKIVAAYRANGIEITAENILAANPGLNAARLRLGQSILIPIKSNATSSTTIVNDIEEQEIRRLQSLIQNSPDLINGPASGDSPLDLAARSGWVRVATFLLDNGANVNKPSGGRTPLHQAVQSGHKPMTELLLQRGADVNARDSKGGTALHQAAEAGFLSIAEVLLKHKADLNARNSKANGGDSPLHLAAKNGHAALATFLIANGDDANRKNNTGKTPLHLAAASGHDGMVTRLLKSGANVNATDNAGATPLLLAAANGHGHLLSVKALLSGKANTDLSDSSGRTALSYAIGQGHSEVVNALLDAKADVNAGAADSPLLLAVRADNAALVERLLRAGADPNRDTDCSHVVNRTSYPLRVKRTPLQAAVSEQHPAMAILLLQSKGDARADNGEGFPLVLNAVSEPGLLEAFLKAGADPNASDGVGRFLLIMAASEGNTASVAVLLKHGANVGVQNQSGMTALHHASLNGHREVMELLLAHKADVNLRDKMGKTPLDYAKEAIPPPAVAGTMGTGTLQLAGGIPVTSDALSSRLPSGAANSASSSNALVTLLRQHGALDDLPDFNSIRVTRQGIVQPHVVFSRSDKFTNQFTLLETLMWLYRRAPVAVSGRIYDAKKDFAFPDLGQIIIHRPGRHPGDAQQEIKVSLLNSNDELDCANDVPLQFGDVIEIPERVHALNEVSTDPASEVERIFAEADRRILPARALREPEALATNSALVTIRAAEAARMANAERLACLRKTIQLTAAGQTATFKMDSWQMAGFLPQAFVRSEARAVLRSSSDLSRVKVTRKDSISGKTVTLTVDLSVSAPADNNLWLQDGDVIEVPDRP